MSIDGNCDGDWGLGIGDWGLFDSFDKEQFLFWIISEISSVISSKFSKHPK